MKFIAMNKQLLKVATPDKFVELGFIEERYNEGVDWNLRTKKFHLVIDMTFVVSVCRLNPDTDYIQLEVNDLSDLQSIIDWVAD